MGISHFSASEGGDCLWPIVRSLLSEGLSFLEIIFCQIFARKKVRKRSLSAYVRGLERFFGQKRLKEGSLSQKKVQKIDSREK